MKINGGSLSLISVIFILSAIMMMTGCAPALHSAAHSGDTKTVIELLDKGANVDEIFGDNTPLILAAANGNIDTVRLLLDRGANINAQGFWAFSPLTWAAVRGHVNVARLLIRRGANIDATMATLEFYEARRNSIWNEEAKTAIKFVERLAKEQNIASQTAMPVLKPSQEVSPVIKSDIDDLPTAIGKPKKNSYAIVIGIENYRQKLPKADFATSDAKLMSEYLIKMMGYPEENVIILLNDHASNVDLAKYFEKWLPNNVEAGSSVFIYYSGHGAPNAKTGDAYLVPYDGDPSFIEQTGYSLKKLYESLNKLQAKEIIVALDSCFSGTGGRSVIAKGARPLVMNLQNNMVLSKNMTVMSASSGDQMSSTYDEKGHGLFTYFMLKGIKNEDVIKQDGSIKMDDLFGYLKPQVERIARKQYNNEQSPQLIEAKKN
jgi:hypothetical protein